MPQAHSAGHQGVSTLPAGLRIAPTEEEFPDDPVILRKQLHSLQDIFRLLFLGMGPFHCSFQVLSRHTSWLYLRFPSGSGLGPCCKVE